MSDKEKDFKSLGKNVHSYEFNYDSSCLDAISKDFDYEPLIKINAPEFTCLCPVTGQPDFATVCINYIPNKHIVESKSLKLYLFSFRNVGIFHEDFVQKVLNDLIKLLDPLYIEVIGKFNPRGGIDIAPFANYAKSGSKYIDLVEKRKFNYLF